MTFGQQLLLELIKAVLTLLLLFVLGQRIVFIWDQRKKYQELDNATYTQFQELQGEFYEMTKVWRALYSKTHKHKYNVLDLDKSTSAELFKRASAAESKVDVMINKLVAERTLCKDDPYTLGLYRQGYQQLRESISEDSHPGFGNYKDPRYKVFEELVSKVAYIVTESNRPENWLGKLGLGGFKSKSFDDAQADRRQVLNVRSRHWKGEARNFVVRRFFKEILIGGNSDVVDNIFAYQPVLHDPDSRQLFHEREGVKKFVREFRTAFPDITHTIEDQYAKVDKVSVSARFTMHGTHKGAYWSIPPTDKKMTISGSSTWRFANDKTEEYKIWGCRFDYDPPGLIKNLGDIPEPEE